MNGPNELPQSTRHSLARRYAAGELSIQELRDAGHVRTIGVLADLAELGLRPPVADLDGPNAATRRAGLERLAHVLKG